MTAACVLALRRAAAWSARHERHPPRDQQTPNQGRFLGSVDIFRRHRRLVCEGELFKLGGTGKTGKSAQALEPRVVHLLSDVLLYSKVDILTEVTMTDWSRCSTHR